MANLLFRRCSTNFSRHLRRSNVRAYYSNPYAFTHLTQSEGGMYAGNPNMATPIRSTTIICVRKNDEVVLMGDGQMTIGSVVAKPNGKKLRKLQQGKVICGFAGFSFFFFFFLSTFLEIS